MVRPKTPSTSEIALRLRDLGERTARFGRDFTAGVNQRDLERLFDREAVDAVSTLAGGLPEVSDSAERNVVGSLRLVKNFITGLALRLSPARRMLFAASLACPLAAIVLAPSAFWYLLSIAGLTLLLALELVDQLRVRDELEVARQLQRELLPQADPEVAGYRIAHSYRTANEIGGDYYDFLPLGDGRLVLAVGDASGHGMSAGLLMAIANAGLKLAIELDPRPSAVLEILNRVLWRTGGRRAFMTLFYGILDPATGELEYACAGHPFPILRRSSGEIVELGCGSLPLGMRHDLRFGDARVTLGPGELLVLYSDGLPEAVGGGDGCREAGSPGEAFGFDRLKGLLAHPHSPRQVHDRILAAFERHLGEHALADDLTLVVIDRAPAPPAPAGA